MGKSFRQRKRQFDDDFYDEPSYNKKKKSDERRIQKRIRNALKTKNIDEVIGAED